MFSLIITIISIALVAALALATLYYGGPIFNQGAERAHAAKLAAQGQQIMGAMELYRAEKGVYPNTLADLVADEYLKSIPVAQADEARALATALAAQSVWTLASPGQPVIVLKPVTLATCMAYNKANLGVSGVLQAPHTSALKSCVGTNVNELSIVQAKAPADMVYVSQNAAAPVQIGTVITGPLPPESDTSPTGWLPISATPPASSVVAFLDAEGAGMPQLAMPATLVGETSSREFRIKNIGQNSLSIVPGSAMVGAPFTLNAESCSEAPLLPDAECWVSMSFTPTMSQGYSGAGYLFSISATGASLPSLPVTGTGVAIATGALSVQTEFGDGDFTLSELTGAPLSGFSHPVNLGRQLFIGADGATPLTFTLANTSQTDVQLKDINFPSRSTSSTCGPVLAKGATCTVTGKLKSRWGSDYFIAHYVMNGVELRLETPLTYTGAQGVYSWAQDPEAEEPNMVYLGTVQAGQTFTGDFHVTNDTDTAVAITPRVDEGLANLTLQSQCGAQVAAHSTCVLTYTYTTTIEEGSSYAGYPPSAWIETNLSVRVEDEMVPFTLGGPEFNVGVQALAFDAPASIDIPAGESRTFTLRNRGAVPATGLSYSTSSFWYQDYALRLQSTTCGPTLAAGATCTFTVNFELGVPGVEVSGQASGSNGGNINVHMTGLSEALKMYPLMVRRN